MKVFQLIMKGVLPLFALFLLVSSDSVSAVTTEAATETEATLQATSSAPSCWISDRSLYIMGSPVTSYRVDTYTSNGYNGAFVATVQTSEGLTNFTVYPEYTKLVISPNDGSSWSVTIYQ